MKVDHVLLTRFNLPTPGVESMVRAQEGWLRSRQRLFERYCLPSVRAQTKQEFSWIIYFDPGSPAWLLERVQALSAEGLFIPIFRETVSANDLREDIARLTGAHGEALMTTNLDNDDGLARDFVERLGRTRWTGERFAVYQTRGLIKQGNRVYLRKDRTNAFCSVLETWQDPVTCWADWHNLLGNQMLVREVAGTPAWLQVVHRGNVSNRVRGVRVSPSAYTALFGDALSDVSAPSWREVLVEAAIAVPRRAAVEAGRSVIKAMTLRVAGRDGLDRLKRLRTNGSGRTGAVDMGRRVAAPASVFDRTEPGGGES